jgi:hypothetical protein
LLCKNLPFVYIISISGRVSKDHLEEISKGEIRIQDIRKGFESKTKSIFDKIGGVISHNRRNLGVSEQVSLIVASIKAKNLKELGEVAGELGRKMIESQIVEADIERLNQIIREKDIFRNIGINPGGLISISRLSNNYFSFISQSNSV